MKSEESSGEAIGAADAVKPGVLRSISITYVLAPYLLWIPFVAGMLALGLLTTWPFGIPVILGAAFGLAISWAAGRRTYAMRNGDTLKVQNFYRRYEVELAEAAIATTHTFPLSHQTKCLAVSTSGGMRTVHATMLMERGARDDARFSAFATRLGLTYQPKSRSERRSAW